MGFRPIEAMVANAPRAKLFRQRIDFPRARLTAR